MFWTFLLLTKENMASCARAFSEAKKSRGICSLLRSRFLGCHATLPPKKRLLTSEQHSFHEISQSPLPFHFQERFRAKFALWNLSNQRMFFIFVSRRGRCHKWTYRFPAFVYGRRKIPAMPEQTFYVAEDSSKFRLIIRSFQLKKLLSRRKISILTW